MLMLRLPALFGIELRVHWTVVLSLAIITGGVSQSGLLGASAMHSPWRLYSLSVATAVLFFASILLHELSHGLVARRMGLKVLFISLILFDGASKIERPHTAKQEAIMAIAGPMANLSLGLLFGFTYFASRAFIPATANVMATMAGVNVLLGLYNLLPALPMDGGRVLRGLLWSRCRSYQEATRIISRMANFIWLAGAGTALVILPANPFFAITVAMTCYLMRSSSVSTYRRLLQVEAA